MTPDENRGDRTDYARLMAETASAAVPCRGLGFLVAQPPFEPCRTLLAGLGCVDLLDHLDCRVRGAVAFGRALLPTLLLGLGRCVCDDERVSLVPLPAGQATSARDREEMHRAGILGHVDPPRHTTTRQG